MYLIERDRRMRAEAEFQASVEMLDMLDGKPEMKVRIGLN